MNIKPGTLVEIDGNLSPAFAFYRNTSKKSCVCQYETTNKKLGILKNGDIGLFLEKIKTKPNIVYYPISFGFDARILINGVICKVFLKDLKVITDNDQD